jgi:superfamily II DNA/RNA helicase
MTAAERAGVQARFNETGGLLLATDAAAEGLNLQRRCRIVVNYELP